MLPVMQRPGSGPDSLWSPARRGLTIGLVLTITLVAFEALAVSTVLPIVARDLGDLEHYGWVFTSFFLGSLIGIAVVGGVINQGGLGRPLAIGLGLFAIGLLIGGLAVSMPMLIGARFIQGLGAGAIPPIAYVAIGRSLPESLRPRMFATLSTAWVLPGVIGPAIAGVVGETLGWRYVFLGLLPLIAVAGLLTYRAVSRVVPSGPAVDAEAAAATAERHRFPNALLVALGAGLVMVGLTPGHGGVVPLDSEPGVTLGLIAAGLVVGIPALRRLTPPGTLTARPVLPAAVLLRGVMTFTFFAVDAYATLTLESWRGLSAIAAGIVLTAATVSWTAGSWIQARYASRWPTARFVRAGLVVTVIGLIAFSTILAPSVPVALAVPTFALAGLGMGLGYAPLSLIVLREAPPETQGAATSALSLSDTLGTALGTGVSGAIVAASIRSTGGPVDGLVGAFAVAILVGIGGVLLTSRLHGRSAATPAIAVATRATSA
jgi:MFS family permease